MATFKIKFSPSAEDGEKGRVYYQVIHDRAEGQIVTGYRLYAHEWDCNRCKIVISSVSDAGRRQHLLLLEKKIEKDAGRLRSVFALLKKKKVSYSVKDIISAFFFRHKELHFCAFMRDTIGGLNRLGKIRTSETYRSTLNSFLRFRQGDENLLVDNVDSDLMLAYEAWLGQEGVSPNTASFYMRILRATYNRAVDKNLTTQRFPFKHVYTGIGKTVKRAVSLDVIKKLKRMNLPFHSPQHYARDLFLFSFYTRGMSFVDMAFLKKKDLSGGILSYRRRKTGQLLVIKWESCMQEIIDKYDTAGSPYLLPIIHKNGTDERKQYLSNLHHVNKHLKLIGTKLGLSIPMTLYVARHAWASIAKSKDIPISVISAGMGHDSEMTTRIYLASLDSEVIDKANSLILKSL